MEKALKIINKLHEKGFIDDYAIGGGIAVLFYSEPLLTYDLDLFIFLPKQEARPSPIIHLDEIYAELKRLGGKPDREHVIIDGLPVQFIPAYNPLIHEAVEKAKKVSFRRVPTRVVSLEHLLAIFLETNRPKDISRVVDLMQRVRINKKVFEDILKRHHLFERWINVEKKYEL